MPGKLNADVHVVDATGVGHILPAGEDVPRWAVRLIDNAGVWAEQPGPDSDDDPLPDRADRKDVWLQFAREHDVDVDDDATKDEVVAAVRAKLGR